MAAKIARVGDTVTGICNGHQNPIPFTGTWITGSPNVTVNGIAVVRLGDTGQANCGHTFVASTASDIIKADGIFIHRVGDQVLPIPGGSGSTVSGSPNVDSE